MDRPEKKYDTHIRLDADVGKEAKERAKRANRTIPAEINRALRIAYKLGVAQNE